MAKVIKPYRRQLAGVSFSAPGGSVAATNEGLDIIQDTKTRINKLTEFASQQVGEELLVQGQIEALNNPIDVTAYANASDEERKKMVGGNTITAKGKQIRQTQFTMLASAMSLQSDLEIANFHRQAVKQNMSVQEYQKSLSEIAVGFKQAMQEADPTIYTKYANSLDTTTATYNKAFLSEKITEDKVKRQGAVEFYMNHTLENKLKVFLSDSYVLSVQDTKGNTFRVTADEALNKELENEVAKLLDLDATAAQIKTFISDWNTKTLQYKKNLLFTRLDSPENRLPQNRYKTYQGYITGNFGGNKDSQALFNSLDVADKQKVQKEAIDWLKNLNDTDENLEKQKLITHKKTTDSLKEDYLLLREDPATEGDLQKVENIKNDLMSLLPYDEFIKFEKTYQADLDSGIFDGPLAKDILLQESIDGTVDLDLLLYLRDKKVISNKTFTTEIKNLKTARKEGVTEALTDLKSYYVPSGYIARNPTAKLELQKEFLLAKQDLLDYVDANKGISKREILNYVKEIQAEQKAEKVKQAAENAVKKKVTTELSKPKFSEAMQNLYSLPPYKDKLPYDNLTIPNIKNLINDRQAIEFFIDSLKILETNFLGDKNPDVNGLFDTPFFTDKLHTYNTGQIERIIQLLEEYRENL
jgi:hypothetical protein